MPSFGQPDLRPAVLFEFQTMNGGEFSMLAVLGELKRRGISPVILAPATGDVRDVYEREGFEVIPFDLRSFRDNNDGLVSNLNQLIESHQVTNLHSNSLTAGRILGRISERISVPVTSHVRDIMKLSAKAISELNTLSGIIAVSNATRDFHVQHGLCPSRVITIHNGICSELFCKRPRQGWLREQLNLPEHVTIVATIGQICLRKGQDLLPKIAAKLQEIQREIHFVLVGQRFSSKPESIAHDEQIGVEFAELNLSRRFHRLGWCDDVKTLYPEIDLLLHVARQEPLGRVLIESAATETPIVATDVGGTSEIVMPDLHALLTPTNDVDALASSVCRTLKESELTSQRVKSARERILENFSISAAASGHVQFWSQSLLEARR